MKVVRDRENEADVSSPPPRASLTLISHHLCPYVQRAAISLTEKGVAHERIYIDLANKPDWFVRLSPLGRTPLLMAGEVAIFESAVILEYLEESQPNPLHPPDPLRRAEHRSWIEFGSAILNDIAGLYSAGDREAFTARIEALRSKFVRLEQRLIAQPWFDGSAFCCVDVVFGPVFRYFDAFDRIDEFDVLSERPKLAKWRASLAARPSIAGAVTEGYDERLWDFLGNRGSYLASLMPRP